MQENGPGVRVPEQGSKSDVISRSPGDRLCSVCKEKKSKYRCPACQAASCSLECSKKHKELTGCTGKRNRTEFISLGDFNDSRLMSDYHVLEEAAAAAESAARGRSRSSQDADQNRQLRRQAGIRNMTWEAMPPGSERREQNSSYYDPRRQRLLWRVEWRFVAADYTVVDEQLDEQVKLREVLAGHLDMRAGQALKHQLLKKFVDAGSEQIALLLRQEHRPANDPAYHLLKPHQTLRLALSQKIIVENPVILVVLKKDLPSYHVLRPGEPWQADGAKSGNSQQHGGSRMTSWQQSTGQDATS